MTPLDRVLAPNLRLARGRRTAAAIVRLGAALGCANVSSPQVWGANLGPKALFAGFRRLL